MIPTTFDTTRPSNFVWITMIESIANIIAKNSGEMAQAAFPIPYNTLVTMRIGIKMIVITNILLKLINFIAFVLIDAMNKNNKTTPQVTADNCGKDNSIILIIIFVYLDLFFFVTVKLLKKMDGGKDPPPTLMDALADRNVQRSYFLSVS